MLFYISMRVWVHFITSVVFLLSLNSAKATLGEPTESITVDQIKLKMTDRTLMQNKLLQNKNKMVNRKFSIFHMESPSSNVRQYANSSGVVFAVTWSGLLPPNLKQLLGSYHTDFQQADDARDKRMPTRRASVLRRGKLVVERWGMMRNLRGRAYDLSLVPAGVKLSEIH